MSDGHWPPILTGPVASAARAAARAIADDLAHETIVVVPGDAAAVALFFAYAAGEWDDDATNAAYARAVERLVAQLDGEHAYLHLFGGLAGDGWVLAHIGGEGVGNALTAIDQVLLDQLASSPEYDLGGGLVGTGVYFVERIVNDPAAELPREGLAGVVGHLVARSRKMHDGTSWETTRDGRTFFDCGAAHGVAGVVALLAKAIELGIASDRELLGSAMEWLWAQAGPVTPRGRFPAQVHPTSAPHATSALQPPQEKRAPHPTRTAWCYGDPGVALLAWNACARSGADITAARDLLALVSGREPTASGIVDAGLCHGAAGLGHLLGRAYAASGDAALRAASTRWFERALAFRRDGGIGGFWSPPPGGQTGDWSPSAGFLEGATGIGLTLLGALGTAEPAWDRLLLVDVPQAVR